MEISIRNSQRLQVDHSRLVATAEAVLSAEGCGQPCELSVLLVDDEEIGKLNRKYLSKDGPTDVLSFYQKETSEERGGVLGDVVISVETANRQAREREKSLDDEMDLLLAHGILHLLGYTDYTDETRRRMHDRAAEIIGPEAAR